MRADAALADRRNEVRKAARGWRRAGAIDAAALDAILASYPDDRARLGPMFRVVAFVFGLLALNAFFGVIGLATGGSRSFAVACAVFAIVLLAATEILVGPLRRADSGIETATGLLSLVYALVAFGMLFPHAFGSERGFIAALLALGTLLAGLGSARWGSPLLALIAGACTFFLLARLPAGRLLWIVASLLALTWLLRASESGRLPPAHRLSFRISVVLVLCAFYLAVHLGSWDNRWLEWLADFSGDQGGPLPWMRPLSVAATALAPIAIVGFGAATRRAYLLDLGILLGVTSLVTLRFYVHVAPLWLVLVASGSAALLLALAVRRLLASGPERERAGLTAEALFEDPARRPAMEIAGAVVAFSPGARVLGQEAGLKPGGGSYGGGGATSDF